MMRRLFILVMVVATAYGGYWFYGARSAETGARDALEALSQDGWNVSYDSLNTRGFPSRFDTTVTDLALTSPQGVTYAAPFLQAFALSYRPNRIIAAFPPSQTIALDAGTLTIASDGMRASAAVRANTALSFAEATLVADMLALSSDVAGVRMRDVLAAARSAGDNSYDLYAGLKTLTLPDDLWQQMFPHGALPLSVDSIVVDATATLEAPLDRFTEDAAIVGMVLKSASVQWGDFDLVATGTLTTDAEGFAAGQIVVEAENAEKLLEGLINISTVEAGFAQTARNVVASMTDETGKLSVPLTLSNGQISWGFLTLGPAPRFR